jgi:hypothetical protein
VRVHPEEHPLIYAAAPPTSLAGLLLTEFRKNGGAPVLFDFHGFFSHLSSL